MIGEGLQLPLPPLPPAAACRLPPNAVRLVLHCEHPQAADGPIDAPKTVEDVRKEPYGLPQKCANAVALTAVVLLVAVACALPSALHTPHVCTVVVPMTACCVSHCFLWAACMPSRGQAVKMFKHLHCSAESSLYLCLAPSS